MIVAEATAREVGNLTLAEALDLVALVAFKDPPRTFPLPDSLAAPAPRRGRTRDDRADLARSAPRQRVRDDRGGDERRLRQLGYASRVLGHTSPAITLSIYAHEFANAEHADRARERMEQAFGALLPGDPVETGARNEAKPRQPKMAPASQSGG